MASNDRRPKLQGLSDDDTTRIRAYGLSRGFLPTELEPVPPSAPLAAPSAPPPAAPLPTMVPPPAAPLPTAPAPVAAEPPTPGPAAPAAAPAPVVIRPAATRPWQAMFPDYLIDDLRQAAAREGTAQKVLVLRALRAAGFRVEDIDLQDLRKR